MPFKEKDGTLWFTATEFSRIHKISRQSVFDWIKQGRISESAIQKISNHMVLVREDALIEAAKGFDSRRKRRRGKKDSTETPNQQTES